MGHVRTFSMAAIATLASLTAPASAAAPSTPIQVGLVRGGDDWLSARLTTALNRVATSTAGLGIAPVGTIGSVSVMFDMPRTRGGYRFTMHILQGHWRAMSGRRFAGFDVHCDFRQLDACAGKILARVQSRVNREA